MAYQALYRVWRPQQLSDMVGQEHITKTLQNALVKEQLSHAYLFSGPRGTGKTSAAKIMAKAMNCEQAPAPEPCNVCTACTGIQDGSVVDVVEIDAASNNGVDEIRYIREHVMSSPRDVRYKVYIIDEVHMLSTGAFNALLKTLEEPPGHVVFMMATTEPHKIPLTILSRLQRFDFKRITQQALMDRSRYILEASGVSIEERALAAVSRAAEGGMRDALSLLDQAVSFADGTIQEADVLALTGSVSGAFLSDVIEAIRKQETSQAVEAADRLIQDGKDPLRFMEDIIYFVRDLLLHQSAPGLEHVLDRAEADEGFSSLAQAVDASWCYDVIAVCNQYFQEMKQSNHPKIHLELALIHLCRLEAKPETAEGGGAAVDALEKKIEQLENEISRLKSEGVPAAKEAANQTQPERSPQPRRQTSGSKDAKRVEAMLAEASKEQRQYLLEQWGSVLAQVKSQSVPAHAWLSDAKPAAVSSSAFTLVFQNEMHRGMVDTKFRELVEQTVAKATGSERELLTLLNPQWEKLVEAYKESPQPQQQPSGDPTGAVNDEVESASEDPLVDEAVKRFGEELIEVKDN
ncbi:DNA polymerase-3 subunit gamma/tau [Salsuginibacillus halophilus]|uniref:DNA-directed DNA polymerase n=1 Tax=Salsuginibacillus halophilus TaxID=517424 RepID=A0A2P8HID2_9BACI|nr:DNA polymerase III subunit gamma/tau [Salsuginibacillus halophilus]PSL45965.1 DNA polymerase-3 subunit gamma/tau [Salsuginibacillus halophilus]